jgi:hypothetical protein
LGIRIRIQAGPKLYSKKAKTNKISCLKSLNVLWRGSRRHVYMTVFDPKFSICLFFNNFFSNLGFDLDWIRIQH